MNSRTVAAPALLRSAAGATRRLVLSLSAGGELEEACTLLPELKGGWMQLAPAAESPSGLLSSVVDARHAVLVWGELDRAPGQSTAQTVSAEWLAKGSSAVRHLEGCFSAVLVDRIKGEVLLVSDLLGRRSLRYVQHEGMLLVSPHDLVLVASGAPAPSLDLQAVAAAVVNEWSLQGQGLVTPLQVCRPTTCVRWVHGVVQQEEAPLVDCHDRLDVSNRQACSDQVDRIIEIMRAKALRFVAAAGDIELDLTAGIDTRAVLSLLLSVSDRSRLHAMTRGEEQSLEVRVARRLAGSCGVRYSSETPKLPTSSEFLRHCDLLAFHMNGDTSGKRAVNRIPAEAHRFTPHAIGQGGSIFKAIYYANTPLIDEGSLSFDAASGILQRRLRAKCRALPWDQPDRIAYALEERLRKTLDVYRPFASDGCDALDLFYLYERYGVWGAMVTRLPWLRAQWDPFDGAQLAQLVLNLPPRLRTQLVVHQRLIRRYMPQGYWTRVNGTEWPALYGQGLLQRRGRDFQNWGSSTSERIRRKLGIRRQPAQCKTIDQLRSEAFAGPLAETVRELLMAEGSVGQLLFGRRGMEQIIEEHVNGQRDHLSALGGLIMAERWRRMVQETSRIATNMERCER